MDRSVGLQKQILNPLDRPIDKVNRPNDQVIRPDRMGGLFEREKLEN